MSPRVTRSETGTTSENEFEDDVVLVPCPEGAEGNGNEQQTSLGNVVLGNDIPERGRTVTRINPFTGLTYDATIIARTGQPKHAICAACYRAVQVTDNGVAQTHRPLPRHKSAKRRTREDVCEGSKGPVLHGQRVEVR